jgi:hypothetical protein
MMLLNRIIACMFELCEKTSILLKRVKFKQKNDKKIKKSILFKKLNVSKVCYKYVTEVCSYVKVKG